jgi:hypothetical protein
MTFGDAGKYHKLVTSNFNAERAVGELGRGNSSCFCHRDPGYSCAHLGLTRQSMCDTTLVVGIAVSIPDVQHYQLSSRQHVEFAICQHINIIRIKSRRMRWTGHVARMGRRGTRIDYWWESQRERDH